MELVSADSRLFPLGVATGPAHCNRTTERAALIENILGGVHTWLWSRRRMGKTSLVEQVLEDLAHSRRRVAAITIDLLVVQADAIRQIPRKPGRWTDVAAMVTTSSRTGGDGSIIIGGSDCGPGYDRDRSSRRNGA